MGRREICKSLGLLSSITEPKVLLQEAGTMGQVPTVGCRPSGFIWIKTNFGDWIMGG